MSRPYPEIKPYRPPRWLAPLSLVVLLSLFIGTVFASQLSSMTGSPLGSDSEASGKTPMMASISGEQMALGTAGTVASYSHTLTNNGGQTETFHMVVTSRQGWTVAVNPTQMTLAPGASTTLTIDLTIPANAAPGTQALTILTVTNTQPAPPIVLGVKDTILVDAGTALKIPPAQWGEMVDGERVYSLTEMISTTEFLPGLDTPTYGYNGSFLGPTLVMTAGEVISISVTNNLTETSTTHWHGIHLPGQMDGGPHQDILPGTTWHPTFTMINQASTLWYHPHPHHGAEHEPSAVSVAATGYQVYYGLAGMIFVRDSHADSLNLPQTYGVDEFPIVVQDRNFNEDGSFREYPAQQDRDLHKGDHFLINGTLAGNLDVPAQMVRLHILNGSNARFYNFGFSDNRSFTQIASDNALLNSGVSRTRVVLGPGERAEIVVDLSGDEGETLSFANYAAEFGNGDLGPTSLDDYDQSNYILFTLHVTAPTANPVTTLPTVLNNIERIDPSTAVLTRTLTLNIPPSINGMTFQMDTINITTTLGMKEVWRIVNLSEEPHPIHIHDSPFQIISRNGEAPPDYELGWKDTVIVHSLETVLVLKDFSGFYDPDGPFMYHCHILDHEDKGMMGQYIIDTQPAYLPLLQRP